MNSFKNQIAALVGFSLLLGLPAKSLAHERGDGTFTTIDYPGAADTVECCSAILNINPEGQIVGGYLDTIGTGHGFLLSQGSFTTIDYPGSSYTELLGINPQGDIVGTYVDAASNVHGFTLSEGNFTRIDFPGSVSTFTNWVNPEGDIVGGYQSADGTYHGFVLSHSNAGGRSAALVAPSQTNERPKVALPENVSSLTLRRWYFGRFGARLTQPQ